MMNQVLPFYQKTFENKDFDSIENKNQHRKGEQTQENEPKKDEKNSEKTENNKNQEIIFPVQFLKENLSKIGLKKTLLLLKENYGIECVFHPTEKNLLFLRHTSLIDKRNFVELQKSKNEIFKSVIINLEDFGVVALGHKKVQILKDEKEIFEKIKKENEKAVFEKINNFEEVKIETENENVKEIKNEMENKNKNEKEVSEKEIENQQSNRDKNADQIKNNQENENEKDFSIFEQLDGTDFLLYFFNSKWHISCPWFPSEEIGLL